MPGLGSQDRNRRGKTPPPLSPTHQDCHHDADVFGVLPEDIVQGDFGKVNQPAEEHQEAQHLQH